MTHAPSKRIAARTPAPPMSEDRLLKKILHGFPESNDLVVGPGDDCAIVQIGREFQLLKTDCIVEDVHFLRSENPARVGWKALCRPLSDIAAMGGDPCQALITILSPPDLDPAYWVAFYRGLRKAAKRFGVSLAGGEISRQPAGIAVSVALTGRLSGKRFVLRSGGRPGDILFVTGQLGGTIGGHHLDFHPRLAEGRWLAEAGQVNAMMDISDGLGADLPRLARASGCGFDVDLSLLPIRAGSDVTGALSDGEDYELLAAIQPRRAQRMLEHWNEQFPGTRLTRIGVLTDTGTAPAGWPQGWDHFDVVKKRPGSQRGPRSQTSQPL